MGWIANYHHQIGEIGSFLDQERRDYLKGILDQIDVQFDQDTKEHNLKIAFKLPLVGDGIEYEDAKEKRKGYRVLEGDQNTDVSIPLKDNTGKSKSTPLQNYSTVTVITRLWG